MNSELKKTLAHIFFPTRCTCCGKIIYDGWRYCTKCANALPRILPPLCTKCGADELTCSCKGKKMYYTSCAAPFYYVSVVRDGIKRFKFSGKSVAAEGFGKEMADIVTERHGHKAFNVITYVPMTEKAVKERGYNQSKLLAEVVADDLMIQCRELLVKNTENKPQHTLKAVNRSGNVLGVFDCPNPEAVKDKTILLVDDIKTTGATLNECAKILMMAGAKRVDCVCCAIVNRSIK